VRLARWIRQWSYGATVAMLAAAIFHFAGRPISWWTDGYTLTGTAFLVVVCLGAAWATADYIWRALKP